MTNNFYDKADTLPLPVKELYIAGEIENPGIVDFSRLPVHSVIVKETLLESSGSDRFVGAYRYDGYSLFDILNDRLIKKANGNVFQPIIDLFVEIENDHGDKVVFSWGEIYYPVSLHRIIIAASVSRIIPSKTRDLWPLPEESRIISGNDLVTERNISSPVKITVRSHPLPWKTGKGDGNMFSAGFDLLKGQGQLGSIYELPAGLTRQTFNTIFYGRGRGIHSTKPFRGVPLKDLLTSHYPYTRENIQTGLFCLAGIDGYRCSCSYSEIMNRNDQQEFLLVRCTEAEDGGLYRIFAACDFFSDRAVKSLAGVYLAY